MKKAAIIYVNYGPYHLARARALSLRGDIEPYFIQIAATQEKYPWAVGEDRSTPPLITIANQPYEQSSPASILRTLQRTLSSIDPDVVVPCGYSEYPMLASIVWARARRKRIVLIFETSEADRPRSRLFELAKRSFLRVFTDTIFCGGTSHEAYLNRLGVASTRVWGKCLVVDNDFFQRQPRERLIPGDDVAALGGMRRPFFLYVGRLSREKNLLKLLNAYARYRLAEPDGWGLVIVGDGPQRDELTRFAERAGLPDVAWTGFKQLDQLASYYAKASCFVLPSVTEPWGLVVNEAMASGLPALVSERCGCVPDLVQPGKNGFTFNPDEESQLASYMSVVSNLEAASLSEMGRRSLDIIGQFSLEAWSDNLIAAIAAAGASRSGAHS